MKKILESAAIVAWILLVYFAFAAIYGPNKLPEHFATHFGVNGKANGWGTPQSLWIFPILGTALGLLMTFVSRYPRSFNYPVRVTRENQARLEELALGMIAWLRLELLFLFAWIEWMTIATARSNRLTLPPGGLLVAIVVIFGTITAHLVGMVKAR